MRNRIVFDLIRRVSVALFFSFHCFCYPSELKLDSLTGLLLKPLPVKEKIKINIQLGFESSVRNDNKQAISYMGEAFRLSLNNSMVFYDTVFIKLSELVKSKLDKADSSAIQYIESGLLQAENFNNTHFLRKLLIYKGSYLRLTGRINESIKLLQALLSSIPATDLVYRPFILRSLGESYSIYSDYSNALKYMLSAQRLFSKAGKVYESYECINNIGAIYFMIEEYEKCLPFVLQSLNYSKSIHDTLGLAESYMNIGLVYTKLENPDSAIFYQLKAEDLYKGRSLLKSRAGNLCNLGMSFHVNKEYKKSEETFLKALNLIETTSDLDYLAIICQSLGSLYLDLKNGMKARYYLEKAERISKEIGNNRTRMIVLNELAKVEKGLGRYAQAYKYLEDYSFLKDSIFNLDKMKELSEINIKNAVALNQQKLKGIQEKNDVITKAKFVREKMIRNYLIVGLTLVFFTSGLLYYQRNKIKSEKVRSEKLLLNILPDEIAQELKLNGSTEARQMDEVTVLFTDFKGFTEVAATLTPKELVEEINECFSTFDRIVEKYNVEKIKTIGDAYMAAGGLPKSNDTHAEDVVKAAFEIQLYMEKLKARRILENKLFFEIRIGIHTGPVVAGIVGVKKFAYDIWGDTVNTASRMESSGEIGKVNVSGTTYNLVKNLFSCHYRGKVLAKGKGEIDMYFIERPHWFV